MFSVLSFSNLLGVDDLEPLLHLAALVAPALLVGHQRDVGMLGHALLAVAAVHAAPVLLVAQVVVAAAQTQREKEPDSDAQTNTTHTHRTHAQDTAVSPLGELQVGRVVDDSRRLSVQSLALQAETAARDERQLAPRHAGETLFAPHDVSSFILLYA